MTAQDTANTVSTVGALHTPGIGKQDAGVLIDQQRTRLGLSWEDVAAHIEQPPVWTVAALLGMHPVPAPQAQRVCALLHLDEGIFEALVRQPNRAAAVDTSSDPTIYRFHELIAVYGPALKALIHEKFGDGIMSAINCSVDLDRREHPEGARVKITIDGKFLPYAWVQSSAE